MEKAYKKIFWGLIIATFSINFGSIPIFPAFVGWLIVLSGVSDLEEQISDKQMSIINWCMLGLVLLSLLDTILPFFIEWTWTLILPFLFYPILLSTIELTAFHKLIEASADRFREHNQTSISSDFNRKDRAYLLLMSFSLVLLTISLVVNDETLLFFGVISTIFPRVYVLTVIRALSKERIDVKFEEAF